MVFGLALRVCRHAREPKSSGSALGSALGNRGAVRSAPESVLQGSFCGEQQEEHPSRSLSGALVRAPCCLRALPRALSGSLLEVSLFWAL